MNLNFLEIREDRINAKELVGNDWDKTLVPAFKSERYQRLHDFLESEYRTKQIFSDMYHVFTTFKLASSADVKVVILGQGPYYSPGQATGMSFSVNSGIALPPSLENIYKELYDDVNTIPVNHGYLKKWVDQGILLFSAVLTVPHGDTNGHQGKGQETVIDTAIKALSDYGRVVFILWGGFVQDKIPLIDEEKNVVVKSVYPNPFSTDRGLFSSRPFFRCNDALTKFGESPIDQQLPQEINQPSIA